MSKRRQLFGSGVDLAIRIAYGAVVTVLAGFALVTYQELQRQRSAPVTLPHYAFYIVNNPEKASVVQAIGTWQPANVSAPAETLATTSIECRKAEQRCVESTAIVSLKEKGYLDTSSTVYEVGRWTDEEIVTKPAADKCSARTLSLDLATRQVRCAIAPLPDAENCTVQARTLTLGSSKAAVDATDRKN